MTNCDFDFDKRKNDDRCDEPSMGVDASKTASMKPFWTTAYRRHSKLASSLKLLVALLSIASLVWPWYHLGSAMTSPHEVGASAVTGRRDDNFSARPQILEASAKDAANQIPLETGQPTNTSAFELPSRLSYAPTCPDSCTLPRWLQDYLHWHTDQLYEIQKRKNFSWSQQRLLIVRCVEGDRCGGTADRLKGLPLYLATAAKTKRLLFLRWTRPFPLEEFLVPSPKHFNWTVPDSLLPLLTGNNNEDNKEYKRVFFGGKALNKIIQSAHNQRIWLVEGAIQMTGGSLFRDLVLDLIKKPQQPFLEEEEFVEAPFFFHDLFLTLFRPAPALQLLVEDHMEKLDLWPNEFVTAHIRAKYPGEPYRESWNVTLLQQTVQNAVDCASSLVTNINTNVTKMNHTDFVTSQSPNLPVYVASDTLVSLQAAQEYGRKKTNSPRVVSHLDITSLGNQVQMEKEASVDTKSTDLVIKSEVEEPFVVPHQDPPHLNFAKEEDPSAFFSIFADLFIMSQSRCVSFGAGGFGRFGSLVSFNASCRVAHSTKGKSNSCQNPESH